MRKVERLVNLIALLLDTRRPLTLDQVAELVPGYDASGESLRRMFERDKEELRGLGVPVERAPIDAWGSEEGYFIDPEAYGMPELDLAPDERAALALAARAWSGATRAPGRTPCGPTWTGPARCWPCCWRRCRPASGSCSATGRRAATRPSAPSTPTPW